MHAVISTGADDLRQHYQGAELTSVLDAYMDGLRSAWILGIACAGAAFLASFGLKYRTIIPSPSLKDGPEQSSEGSLGESKGNDTRDNI